MKQCPTCRRAYDETLSFCLDDGSALITEPDSEATYVMPAPTSKSRTTLAAPVHRLPTSPSVATVVPSQERARTNPGLYIVIALLALTAGGGVVALIKWGNNDVPQTTAPALTTPATTTREAAKPHPTANDTQINSASPLTEDGVTNLINRWVAAQNSKDLRAYQSCYAASFRGIKRTASGRSYSYDFNGWMRDRWRMISVAVSLNLEARNLRVSVVGDGATVEFDQYYRSLRYNDWGPKVMKIEMTPSGEKIVYEELKASYPIP